MEPLTDHLLLVAAAVAVSSILHGYSGFGFGFIAMVLFAILGVPLERASVALTLIAVPLLLAFAYLEGSRIRINVKLVALLGAGIIIGTPIGYQAVLRFGNTAAFELGFGVFLIAFALYGLLLSGRTLRMPAWLGAPAGLLGGLIGGAIVSGGPPMVIYVYGRPGDPRDHKGTLQATFLLAAVARIVSAGLGERGITTDVTLTAAAALPVALLCIWVFNRYSRRHSAARFRRIVYVTIGLFGVTIGVRALSALAG